MRNDPVDREQESRFARLDSSAGTRETEFVLAPGASRKHIARTLNAAYADGLISQDTFVRRLDQLLGAQLIDPLGLIGDLTLRRSPRRGFTLVDALAATMRRLRTSRAENAGSPVLLALDWSGGQSELVIGRHRGCDVVLSNPAVSRRHARLVFRDGNWVLQDLQSTNGTAVNGMKVGRCELPTPSPCPSQPPPCRVQRPIARHPPVAERLDPVRGRQPVRSKPPSGSRRSPAPAASPTSSSSSTRSW